MKEIIVSLISMIIFQIAAFYAFGRLSGKKIKIKWVDLIFLFLNFLLQLFAFRVEMRLLAHMLTIVYFYFAYQKLFKSSKEEAKNYGIIIWITCLAFDMITMLIFNTFDLYKYYEENEVISKTIGTVFMSVLLVIYTTLPITRKHLQKAYKKISKLQIPIKSIALVIMVLIIISIMELEFIKNDIVITLLFIIAMLFVVIIIHGIAKNYRIMVLKLTNKLLEENNLTNKKVITEYSILKHNFESELLGIKDVANKEAKSLIDDLLEDTNSSVYIKNDINAMPLGINGLVMGKLAKHEKSNVNISITNDITSNILDVVSPRSYNLFCEALGISLDNALESAKNTKEKLVYLEFKETDTEIKLTVINTFSGGVDLDSLGEVNYTSKKKGHGLGLYSLFRKNLNIKTSIKNNLFINDIAIKKSQVKSE